MKKLDKIATVAMVLGVSVLLLAIAQFFVRAWGLGPLDERVFQYFDTCLYISVPAGLLMVFGFITKLFTCKI